MRARLIHGMLSSAFFVVVACGSTDDGGPLKTADVGGHQDAGADASDDDDPSNDAGTGANDADSNDGGGDPNDDAGSTDAGSDAGESDAGTDAAIDAGPTCADANGGCDPHASCDDSSGTPACTCVTGFEGDGTTCALSSITFATDTNLSTTNAPGRVCADGGDMVAYSVLGLDATTATLGTTVSAGCLAPGDEVLVINLQGTLASSVNTGNHEFRTVASVAGSTVTFAQAKTQFFGDGAADDANLGTDTTNQRVVLQRVPRYGNVIVMAGVRVTADRWNGTRGGVFALSAAGGVTVDGSIDMSGNGYIGAPSNDVENTTGQQGESVDGIGYTETQTASSGGGGGGRGDNTGCDSYGVAGGGGGYGTRGEDAEYVTCGGAGGMAYGDAALSKLFFGSGGGSGGTDNVLFDNPHGGAGGSGGGIVHVRADGTVQGSLVSRGTAGEGDLDGVDCGSGDTNQCWDYSGPGGGGAGGSIVVVAPTFTGTSDVAGGAAGHGWSSTFQLAGAGGSGRAKAP